MLLTFEKFPSLRRYRSTSRTESKTSCHDQAQLTEAQWLLIADLFASPRPTRAGGRPPIPPRPYLEGILWVLRSGARWKAHFTLAKGPREYPSYATCWRRLQDWTEAGLWLKIWGRLVQMTSDLKGLDWQYLVANGTFVPAKRGGAEVGRGRHGVGTTLMVLMDASRTPLAIQIAPANQHEVHLIEPLLNCAVVPLPSQRPPLVTTRRLIATNCVIAWTQRASN